MSVRHERCLLGVESADKNLIEDKFRSLLRSYDIDNSYAMKRHNRPGAAIEVLIEVIVSWGLSELG